ncbi:hypothetical protein GUITHDRAFT_102606 [Guillardia theta CCMP2712]|uniref:Uncharacterized protein n=1 Tax=Guillardia theta (strain CCMP2712) TaxID=905079 RepID=L1JU95_GUITC|nr:hypothetical protein GUITHDRAFT_102606 [Guillardia theta CCMP2712]EKX51992.1 hypothetical protein GUITHDRAFT_102606 [Guillardia theta CCMP2712]|eukprot:XP_005838972.1 hypothetical protein GUITHDRAFT_102606 [Guillardia theta CCMP2712]
MCIASPAASTASCAMALPAESVPPRPAEKATGALSPGTFLEYYGCGATACVVTDGRNLRTDFRKGIKGNATSRRGGGRKP